MQVPGKSPIEASGRGARFLSLVKQNKLNVSPQLVNKRRFSACKALLADRDEAKPNQDTCDSKEYLKFSTQIKFDPDASPSSSILSKRKADPGIPEVSPLTSSMKRKRVGFRDPVSSTKEYLITEEEERSKSTHLSRCLNYEAEAGDDDDDELTNDKENIIQIIKQEIISQETEEEMLESSEPPANQDHDYNGNPQNTDVTTSEDALESPTEDKLTFKDRNELMDYIAKNLTVEELFEKFTQAEEKSLKRKELVEKVVQSVGFNGLIKEFFPTDEPVADKLSADQKELIYGILTEISSLMKRNKNVKHKVLDVLSEEHSEEFLEHSIQENSTSVVCDKITVPKVVNYLIHKVNITEKSENDDLITDMNRSILVHLMNSTQKPGEEIVTDNAEAQTLMHLLFKNKPKMEIFDTVQIFLRTLVENQ